jgi:hypothetical protein
VGDDECASALRQAFDQLPQHQTQQPGLPLDELRVDRPDGLTSAPFPAAFAASRQRSSTDEWRPLASVIGTSSWPAALRSISSVCVQRDAPVDTKATYGGLSRPAIASASATSRGVRRSPSLSVCRRNSTYRVISIRFR